MLTAPPSNPLCWVVGKLRIMMMWRRTAPVANERPMLIAAAAFFAVGMVHGTGMRFGGL